MSDPASESAAPARTPVWVWIVIAVLGAALVFTTTFAVLQKGKADDQHQATSLRDTAASTAGQFGAALFTYGYDDLAGARARVLKLATAAYAKGYAATPQQEEAITRLKANESAKVRGVFLGPVQGDHAAAIVTLDTSLQSTAGNRASTIYLDVTLVRQGSGWKVDTAKPLPVAS